MIGDRCLRVAHHAFILFLVVATVAVLSAQTVVDPRFVEFSPSANHNTNDTDGTPLVQRYSLSVYPVGSSAAFDTMDLGKPTPSGGVIRVDFLPLLHSVPTPGVVFEARVTAIGPGGSTTSSLSNQFSFQGACTYRSRRAVWRSPRAARRQRGRRRGRRLQLVGDVEQRAGSTVTESARAAAGTASGAAYSVGRQHRGSARTGTRGESRGPDRSRSTRRRCRAAIRSRRREIDGGRRGRHGSTSVSVAAGAGCSWTASVTTPAG